MDIVFAAIFGACLGSFGQLLINRLPYRRSVFKPGSQCDHCMTNLRWFELVPLVSYIGLRGVCRTCHTRISHWHLITEIFFAITVAWLYASHGFTDAMVVQLVLIFAAYVACMIDYVHYIIPDEITIGLMIAGLLLCKVNPYVHWSFWTMVLGLVVGGGMTWLLAIIGEKLFKQEALGAGDIKYFAGIGSILGPSAAFVVLLYASIIGGLVSVGLILAKYKKRRDAIPFGPFISAGIVVWLYIGSIL